MIDMACEKCGAPKLEEKDGMLVCPYCGSVFLHDIYSKAHMKESFCIKCGARVGLRAKFCPRCGAAVGKNSVGSTIYRSPEVTSIQRLHNELIAIDNSRRNRSNDTWVQTLFADGDEEYAIHNKKVTLIKSFPIPDKVEEIVEFVIVAAGNIDVSLSKNSLGNRIGRKRYTIKTHDREISDAWVAKLQQAYQKAELLYSDQPIFRRIEEIYTKKMSELNMLN